ncbi:MAG: STM4014 family protein [Alcanivoracaceae bacterium]|nr:STM4014 family protein [Alcanivoracaceae bacterium]
MEFWIIGVVNKRRVKYWVQTVKNLKHPIKIFAYQEFIESSLVKVDNQVTIRIESPSEDFETDRFLLKQGIKQARVSKSDIDQLKFDKGIIRYSSQWYKGWLLTLNQIQEKVNAIKNIKFMNSPNAIALMFDKLNCQKHLSNNSIRVPENYGQIESYDHLQTLVMKHKVGRLFIKPFYGSSASGVMAYQTNSSGRESIVSSIELVTSESSNRLYNNLKIRRYNNKQDIKSIINLMAENRIYCEAWIPKKSVNGMVSDIRVLVINNKACHFVLRKSKSPITNTHLGNVKADINDAIVNWGQNLVDKIKNIAEDAAKTFPDSFYCGVDIAVSNANKAYILEVNAFGDLLLDNYHEGLNTYEMELKEWQNKYHIIYNLR